MKKMLIIFPILIGALFFACSDDDNPFIPDDAVTSTWYPDSGYWESLVNAESNDYYLYFSFNTQEAVAVSDNDASTNDDWDIAFKRYNVKLNGGLSGNKGVVGVDLAVAGSPDSVDFDSVVDTSDITSGDWVEDGIDLVVDAWYSYNYQTHELTPTNNVYLLKDANGDFVKFQVIDLAGVSQTDMGTVTCRFVYAGDGNDVSGAPDTVTLDVGTGIGYVDFSSGMEVTPGNPATSTDWDIAFTDYEIHLNCAVWGAGDASSYSAYLDDDLTGGDPTNFDGITTAVEAFGGFFPDSYESALSGWWGYNSDTHIVYTKDRVFLIKSEGNVYKLQITSYTHPETNTTGWITFRWAELE